MEEDYKFISNGGRIKNIQLIEISTKLYDIDCKRLDTELELYINNNYDEKYCLDFLKWDEKLFSARILETMVKFYDICICKDIKEPCFLIPNFDKNLIHNNTNLDDVFDFYYSKQELEERLSK